MRDSFHILFLQCVFHSVSTLKIFSVSSEKLWDQARLEANDDLREPSLPSNLPFTVVSARIGKEAMEAGREARQWAGLVVILIMVWEAGKFVSLEVPSRGASQSTLLAH